MRTIIIEKLSALEYIALNNQHAEFAQLPRIEQEQKRMSHDRQKQFIAQLQRSLASYGINADLIREDALSSAALSPYDIVFSSGGDGTFLRAARHINGQHIIGCNSDYAPGGSIGALTTLNISNLEHYIAAFASGSLQVELWPRLYSNVNGIAVEPCAVNEVAVADACWYRASHLYLELSGKPVKLPPSCGLIVCTGMGSHAWFKSEHGIPFGNSMDSFGYLLRAPMVKDGSPIITGLLARGNTIRVRPLHDNYELVIDCQSPAYKLRRCDTLEIGLSGNPLHVLKL